MDTALLIGIIGTIGTLGFGIYSVWIYYKQKNSTQITFFRHECFSLFQSIVNNLDGIEINYEGEKINKSLILLSGSIINTGGKDIDNKIVYEPLRIDSISEYKYLQIKLNQVSEGINASVAINANNQIEITWDLLKSNEYLSFTVIVKYEGKEEETGSILDNFIKKIDFTHRITNLRQVLNGTLGKYYNKPTKHIFVAMSILYLLLGLGAICKPLILPQFGITYQIRDGNKSLGVVQIAPKNLNTLKLTAEGDKESLIDEEVFNQSMSVEKVIIYKEEFADSMLMALGVLCLLVGLFIMRRTYTWYYKGGSLYNLTKELKAMQNKA